MIQIQAASRLHFGFFSLPSSYERHWQGLDAVEGLPVRKFGGVGLMIKSPGVNLTIERAHEWKVEGPGNQRALAFARRFVDVLPVHERSAFHIQLKACPPDHIGLGTGTSLGLAVARGIAVASGHTDWDVLKLAKIIQRGERSALGVHGFQSGGFLVEAGKQSPDAISPLIFQSPFPTEWKILLIQFTMSSEWFGGREKKALGEMSFQAGVSEILSRIVLLGMIPALKEGNFDTFAESVTEYNSRVGDQFRSVQGGRYSSGLIGEVVAYLKRIGLRGIGQSSWGPTVFAFLPPEVEYHSVSQLLLKHFSHESLTTLDAAASNQGASAELIG